MIAMDQPGFKLVIVAVIILITNPVSTYQNECGSTEYWNADQDKCVQCSSCPLNQIIRQPCTDYKDTICGPFYEFVNFDQGPDIDFFHSTKESVSDSANEGQGDKGMQHQPVGAPSGSGTNWKEVFFWLLGCTAVLAGCVLLLLAFRVCRSASKNTPNGDVEQPMIGEERGAPDVRNTEFVYIERQMERNRYRRILDVFLGRSNNANEYVPATTFEVKKCSQSPPRPNNSLENVAEDSGSSNARTDSSQTDSSQL